jgi:anti-sigma factor RsiW
MTMSGVADPDGHVRLSLGLYVLGALDPALAEQVEEHLLTCADCQREHDYIAVVPLLMDSMPRAELEGLLRGDAEPGTGSAAGIT